MKKTLKVLLTFALVIGLIAASPKTINASSGIKVLLDGQELTFDVPPQIIEGRTLLPLRVIFESLGLTVGWDNETKIITGTNKDTEIILKLDSTNAQVNGVNKTLDVPAKAINGRTLVPVRFIAESLNLNVVWNQKMRTVTIDIDDEIITFKDPNFEKGVRENLKKLQGTIYKRDIENITELYLGMYPINTPTTKVNSLEGIQNFTNLQRLVINTNNTINDLTPIKDLYNLKKLSIRKSGVVSLEPLRNLKKLEELLIEGSNIEDISPLINLKELKIFIIDDSNVVDITPIKDLEKLKELNLIRNNIQNVAALKDLVNLERIMLTGNNVDNVDILKNMKNLKTLVIHDTKVSNLDVLLEFPKLEFLGAYNIPITKIDFAKVYQPLTKKGVKVLTSYDEAELLSIKIEKELKFDDIDAIFHIDELLKALPISEYAKLFVDNSDYSKEFDSLRLKETEYYERGNISFDFHDKNELSAYFEIGIQNDKNFNYIKDKLKEKYGKPITEDFKESDSSDTIITRWNGISLHRSLDYRNKEDKKTTIRVQLTKTVDNNRNNNQLSIQEIKAYLASNFGTLDTNIGTTKFTFNIHENKSIYSAYDYWIQVGFEFEFFSMAMNSIEYTNEQKTMLRSELKQHQKNIGEALIELLPNKKLYGGYYDSWYRYPNLRVDLITIRYYSWTNYDEPEWGLDISDYEQTKPSYFRWYDLIDDKL